MKSFALKASRQLKNRLGWLWLNAIQRTGRALNNFSPRIKIQSGFISSFRESKKNAVSAFLSGDRIFSWALLESDGRIKKYGDFDFARRSWEEWLNTMLKFQHFQWRAPRDLELIDLTSKIKNMGFITWSALFEKYNFHNLAYHDLYSIPDVYYTIKTLGHVPQSVIDIGGGWGRLGMAWHAVGSRVVGVTDSIEQPYMIQHQYLASIPRIKFYEALGEENNKTLDFNCAAGVVHFPLWFLPKIPNESIEAVSTIQVLREVSKECLEFLFSEVHRILKNDGVWYIRDNDHDYKGMCMHNVHITDYLQNIGFKLVYKSDLVQGKDIHGVPRIFQKVS